MHRDLNLAGKNSKLRGKNNNKNTLKSNTQQHSNAWFEDRGM